MDCQAERCAPSGLALTGRLTVDKREIKDFPKFPSATSFIRHPLSAHCVQGKENGMSYKIILKQISYREKETIII
jgi:hypothetical protein